MVNFQIKNAIADEHLVHIQDVDYEQKLYSGIVQLLSVDVQTVSLPDEYDEAVQSVKDEVEREIAPVIIFILLVFVISMPTHQLHHPEKHAGFYEHEQYLAEKRCVVVNMANVEQVCAGDFRDEKE